MNFGETFFVQIKRLIDQAVVKEASKQAVAYETYKKNRTFKSQGLIQQLDQK